MAIQNILPDPLNPLAEDGQDTGSSVGPGFASIVVTSTQPVLRDSTNSGRTLTRGEAYHNWNLKVSYNPMTKVLFNPVNVFLMQKQLSLTPFFVSVPQYYNQTTNRATNQASPAGSSTLRTSVSTGILTGYILNIDDASDSAHSKTYMVTRVDNGVITIAPKLAKNVSSGATLVFQNPLFRVVQDTETQEYSLGTNNLYSFSLTLKETN